MSILFPNRYAIVLHHPRQIGKLKIVPDTIGMADKVGGGEGKGNPIRIYSKIWEHIRAINDDWGYEYARSVGRMWINTPYGAGETPKAECITCGGNFAKIQRYVSGYYKIAAYDYQTTSIPDSQNWFLFPWLHFKATAIDNFGNVFNVGNGHDVYFPILRVTERWMHYKNVQVFPRIPFGGLVLTRKSDGAKRRFLDYRVRGASVQGLAAAGNWAYLLKSTVPGEREFPFVEWSLPMGVIPPRL